MSTAQVISDWHNCYDDGWQGVIVPEAFAHPAKMAHGLLRRIIRHGLVNGYWNEGDTLGDMFGGVLTTGIVGAYHGLKVVAVELEPRFVDLATQNIALHRQRWQITGDPEPVIIQGDSRWFAELVGSVAGVVKTCCENTTPDDRMVSFNKGDANYAPVEQAGIGASVRALAVEASRDHLAVPDAGLRTKGDRSLLRSQSAARVALDGSATDRAEEEGPVGGETSSIQGRQVESPVSDRDNQGQVSEVCHDQGPGDTSQERRPLRQPLRESGSSVQFMPHERDKTQVVGSEESRLAHSKEQRSCGVEAQGALAGVITSPPYAESISGDHSEQETAQASRDKRKTAGGSLGQSQRNGGYGVADGQIGSLKEGVLDGAVTSPPFQKSLNNGADHARMKEKYPSWGLNEDGSNRMAKSVGTDYGHSDGQVGDLAGETYWQAMAQVYAQMRLAVKPGGICAIVVKDYVKNKVRVPLCDQTCALLESLGFHVFERTRCWLVKSTSHPSLFGGHETKTVSRKSFFRRLAEKNGSPRIDYEETIWCNN